MTAVDEGVVASAAVVAVEAAFDHSAYAYFAATVDRVDAGVEAAVDFVVPAEVAAAAAPEAVAIKEEFENYGGGEELEEAAVALEAEEVVTAVAAEAGAVALHLHLGHSSHLIAGKRPMVVSQHDQRQLR